MPPDSLEAAPKNLVSISPFFIAKDLQTSVAFCRERLGFSSTSKVPTFSGSAMTKRRLPAWLVALFGIAYAFVGKAFPNPPSSSGRQFSWRLAAWLTCAIAFAIHIGLEQFRLRNSPGRTALHAALSVALGACALAAAANIHARTAHTGNERVLALALLIWPIMTGIPAFLVALGAAAVLSRVRPHHAASRRKT